MNAPATPAALTAAAFSLIHITALAPSGTRTQERRRRRFGKQEQAELAARMKARLQKASPLVKGKKR